VARCRLATGDPVFDPDRSQPDDLTWRSGPLLTSRPGSLLASVEGENGTLIITRDEKGSIDSKNIGDLIDRVLA
jgi:hypothetical protein